MQAATSWSVPNHWDMLSSSFDKLLGWAGGDDWMRMTGGADNVCSSALRQLFLVLRLSNLTWLLHGWCSQLLWEVLATHIPVNMCSGIPESVISGFLAHPLLQAMWNWMQGREGMSAVRFYLPLEFGVWSPAKVVQVHFKSNSRSCTHHGYSWNLRLSFLFLFPWICPHFT